MVVPDGRFRRPTHWWSGSPQRMPEHMTLSVDDPVPDQYEPNFQRSFLFYIILLVIVEKNKNLYHKSRSSHTLSTYLWCLNAARDTYQVKKERQPLPRSSDSAHIFLPGASITRRAMANRVSSPGPFFSRRQKNCFCRHQLYCAHALNTRTAIMSLNQTFTSNR